MTEFNVKIVILLSKVKSPREYGVEEPTTRTVNLQNMTSDMIQHLVIFNQSQQIEQVTKPLDSVEPELPWEPLACSNCLNERYQEHYKQKGCKPILIDIPCRKPCPKYFECPKKDKKPILNGMSSNS